jgi:hypothetical protein
MLRARMGIRAHPTFLPMFGRSLLADFGGHVQTPVAGKGLYYVDLCGCWSTWADTPADVKVADGEGFEPPVSVNPRRFSRPVP